MKKLKLTVAILSATLAMSVIPSVVSAADDADEKIVIDTTNFEDPNFVTYLKNIEKKTSNGYDADGAFSKDELLKLTSIKPGENVTSLKGIEKLTSVSSVNINGNQNITSLDLSSNAEMKNVYATNSALEELNVAGCNKITKLDLTGSKINSLDISDCPNINYLDVSNTGNAIKGINITNQKKLIETIYKGEYSLIEGESYNCKKYIMQVNNTPRTLVFDENTDLYLAEINETNFPDSSIYYMVNRWMNPNHDQYLSLSEKEKVTDIRLNYGTITSLKGLEYFDKVISLYWNECRLKEANLDCFPELETLEIYSNYLTSLDLSANTKLKKLRCENNKLTSLDISNNSELEELYCQNNQLTSLVVSNNPELKILNCSSNNISTIDISNNLKLIDFRCGDNNFSSLDISKNVNLQKLYFAENSISEFDVSHMLNLKELDCAKNGVSKVDVSNNRYLEILNCSKNNISEVDVSKNPNLLSLKCAINNISELDISKNLLLEELDCSENKLTEVNILKLDNIRSLNCSCNEISSLEFSPNATKLKSLHCRDNKFTTLDVSRFTELTKLSCYKNKIAEIDVSNTSLTTLFHYQPCLDARLNYSFDSYYSGGNAGIDSYLDVDEDTNIVGLIKFPHDSIITPTPTLTPVPTPTTVPVKPTAEPTKVPTATPSSTPTAAPTAAPGVKPTTAPSATPTKVPTSVLDGKPTVVPTTVPVGKPTLSPSKPGVTVAPNVTSIPGTTSSPNPTVAPGATNAPSTPTATPTPKPSKPQTGVSDKAGTVEDFAERLYTTCLGREAEKAGKDYWVGELKAGKPGSEVAQGFFFSPEFTGLNLSNEEYITRLYRTFMGREPDKNGMNYWLGEMKNGQGRVFVFDGFVNSPEWADICLTYGIRSGGLAEPTFEKQASKEVLAFAERLYTTCLGRDAEPEGLKYWSQELANLRQTGTVAASGFFNSPEFISLNTSNEEYITRLYRTFMGREPEKAGFDYWMSELKAGKDRQNVFDGFSVAPEFANLCADAGIMR